MRRRLATVAAVAWLVAATSGCWAFPHSDRTLTICGGSLGWGSKACGDSVCVDWHNRYGWTELCPYYIQYATGPR